jgi:hypothetical protein
MRLNLARKAHTMWCDSCESDPCRCQRKLIVQTQRQFVIQHCTACQITAVRVPIAHTLTEPICKWCEAKRTAELPVEA